MNNEDNKDFMINVNLEATFAEMNNFAAGIDESRLNDPEYFASLLNRVQNIGDKQQIAIEEWAEKERKSMREDNA